MSAASASKTPSPGNLAYAKRTVAPAKLDKSSVYHDEKTCFLFNQLEYTVPLKHDPKDAETITVTARVVLKQKGERRPDWKNQPTKVTEVKDDGNTFRVEADKPIAVYLVGGPGSDNPPLVNSEVTDHYLALGFQVLFMDYRGTGSSTLQRADDLDPVAFKNNAMAYKNGVTPTLAGLDAETQAERLTWFRQDNIVRDLEAIRKSLVDHGITTAKKWTLVGQSYGGWVSFTYLSFYPEALHMAIVTGGIPPVGQEADDVYTNTYNTVIKACDNFYAEFPEHEEHVRRIIKHIHDRNTPYQMPGGGILTPERFLCVGRTLGTTNGNGKVDSAITSCTTDLKDANENYTGQLSFKTLEKIESWLRFEERPLYAILQEPIYTERPLRASNWSAEKIGNSLDKYWWLKSGALDRALSPKTAEDKAFAEEHFDNKRIYLSAEHVYHFHYDQFHALQPLKQAAEILASKDDWPPIFDINQLRQNKVPISSLSYDKDMFIDGQMSHKTLDKMENSHIEAMFSPTLMHTALKDTTDKVLPPLWENLCKLVGVEHAEGELKPATDLIVALEDQVKKAKN